jgi:hypothetical protein
MISVIGRGPVCLFPVRRVVARFGDIGESIKKFSATEWVTEAASLIYRGVPIVLSDLADRTSRAVLTGYQLTVGILHVLPAGL